MKSSIEEFNNLKSIGKAKSVVMKNFLLFFQQKAKRWTKNTKVKDDEKECREKFTQSRWSDQRHCVVVLCENGNKGNFSVNFVLPWWREREKKTRTKSDKSWFSRLTTSMEWSSGEMENFSFQVFRWKSLSQSTRLFGDVSKHFFYSCSFLSPSVQLMLMLENSN